MVGVGIWAIHLGPRPADASLPPTDILCLDLRPFPGGSHSLVWTGESPLCFINGHCLKVSSRGHFYIPAGFLKFFFSLGCGCFGGGLRCCWARTSPSRRWLVYYFHRAVGAEGDYFRSVIFTLLISIVRSQRKQSKTGKQKTFSIPDLLALTWGCQGNVPKLERLWCWRLFNVFLDV